MLLVSQNKHSVFNTDNMIGIRKVKRVGENQDLYIIEIMYNKDSFILGTYDDLEEADDEFERILSILSGGVYHE